MQEAILFFSFKSCDFQPWLAACSKCLILVNNFCLYQISQNSFSYTIKGEIVRAQFHNTCPFVEDLGKAI